MTVHQLAEGTEFSDRGNVWLWSRPLRFGDGGGGAGAWRVPLPLDGACMALGHLLELLLLGHALEIMGLPVQVRVKMRCNGAEVALVVGPQSRS